MRITQQSSNPTAPLHTETDVQADGPNTEPVSNCMRLCPSHHLEIVRFFSQRSKTGH